MTGLKPADHFKFDEEKALPVTEFFNTYKEKLPMMAIIVDGIYGPTRYDTFDCYQVVRLNCYTSQPRIVCMKESEARKPSFSYITIPLYTNLRFQVVGDKNNVSKPMLLTTLLKKCPLPLLTRIDPSDNRRTFKMGTTTYAVKNFGNILMLEKYEEHYFKLNCLSDGPDLNMNPVAGMLCLNDEISLSPITGFKHKSQQHFMGFMKHLDDQVAAHSSQYDTTDGDPNFSEHLNNPSSHLTDGRAIPIKLAPAQALRLIRSLRDTPLPAHLSTDGTQTRSSLHPPGRSQSTEFGRPPRPPPRLPARSISTDIKPNQQQIDEDNGDYEECIAEPLASVIPPRVGGHRPFNASNKNVVLGPVKSPITKQGVVNRSPKDSVDIGDYEDLGDYEIPVTDYLHPISSPKPTTKSQCYIMGELQSKLNKTTHETSQTKTTKNTIFSQDKDSSEKEVHESKGKTISGYVNTTIGRIHVKPQEQQLPGGTGDGEPDGNYTTTYDDVMIVPDQVTDSVETHSLDAGYIQEDEYSVIPEVDLPLLSQNHPRPQPQRDQSGNTYNSTGTGQANGATFAGVKHLSMAEVADVLQTLALDKYVKVFKDNKIDGEILSALTTDILVTELNMKKLEAIRLDKYVNAGHIPK